MAGGQGRVGGRRPGRRIVRQARQIGPRPAEGREVGVGGAGWPEQLHQRRMGLQGLAIALQEQVVDPAALQGDGALQAGRVDADPRAGRGRLFARHRDHSLRQGDALRRLGFDRGPRLGFGLSSLGRRLQDEDLVEHHQRHGADDEYHRVLGIVLHWAMGDRGLARGRDADGLNWARGLTARFSRRQADGSTSGPSFPAWR